MFCPSAATMPQNGAKNSKMKPNNHPNKVVERYARKLAPLTTDVQRQKILKNYGEIATTTATEGEYGKKSALCRKK